MNNNEGGDMNNDNDYGDEQFDEDGMNDQQLNEDGLMGNQGANGDNDQEDGEVDQYFDDAGDIGYLPADHVRKCTCTHIFNIATDGKATKCFDEATD